MTGEAGDRIRTPTLQVPQNHHDRSRQANHVGAILIGEIHPDPNAVHKRKSIGGDSPLQPHGYDWSARAIIVFNRGTHRINRARSVPHCTNRDRLTSADRYVLRTTGMDGHATKFVYRDSAAGLYQNSLNAL